MPQTLSLNERRGILEDVERLGDGIYRDPSNSYHEHGMGTVVPWLSRNPGYGYRP